MQYCILYCIRTVYCRTKNQTFSEELNFLILTKLAKFFLLKTKPAKLCLLLTKPAKLCLLLNKPAKLCLLLTKPAKLCLLLTKPAKLCLVLTRPAKLCVLLTKPTKLFNSIQDNFIGQNNCFTHTLIYNHALRFKAIWKKNEKEN